MQIYNNRNGKLEYIKEIWFKLEKDMQALVEKNLWEIFGLEFIQSEFQLNNLRIDTLAFDRETNSFVIIEFKIKWQNLDIAQGLAYLSLLLNNKAEFVQKLSILRNKVIKNDEIDWTQSRVIFISENFTEHQKESINFKDLPISLFEMKQLNNWEIIFNEIKARNKTESIKTITKNEWKFLEVAKEIETYDEEYHINWKSDEIIELYEKLKQAIFSIDSNIDILPKKLYIAYKINKRNLVDIEIRKNDIKLWINAKKWDIVDSFWISKDVSDTWHWWNWDFEIKIYFNTNLIQIMELIQQAYKIYN